MRRRSRAQEEKDRKKFADGKIEIIEERNCRDTAFGPRKIARRVHMAPDTPRGVLADVGSRTGLLTYASRSLANVLPASHLLGLPTI
jgi:hypothetical protein